MKKSSWRKGNESRHSDLFNESGCLNELGFSRYLSESHAESERRILEHHLAHCNECSEKLAHFIRAPYVEPTEEELTTYATTPEDIDRYTKLITSHLQKPAPKEPARSRLFTIFHGLAAPRFGYALLVILAMVLAGAFVWMRYVRRGDELYAQGIESLNSLSKFETTSGLRLTASPVKTELHSTSTPDGDVRALDRALFYFGQALALNSKSVPARIALGHIYLLKGESREACEHFQEALKLDGSNLDATNGLGVALFERAMAERDPHAKDELLRASSHTFDKISMTTSAPLEVLYNQALACYELGDKAKTLDRIEKYLARDPKSKWAEKLSSIRDKLRLSGYDIFYREVNEAFRNRQIDRLAQIVSRSPHGAWLIKGSLRLALKREAEGDLDGARQEFAIAEAVERAYRRSTGDDNYLRLIDFYKKLTDQQKRRKHQAIRTMEEAFLHYRNGNLDKSLALSAEALAISKKLGDDWDGAYINHVRGNCYFYRLSDYALALSVYEAAAVAARNAGDYDQLAQALGNISVIYQDKGDYYKMKRYLDDMLATAEKIGNTMHRAFALNYLGNFYRELGHWQLSMRHYSQALALSRETGNQNGQLENLEHISFLYQRNKEYEKSVGFL